MIKKTINISEYFRDECPPGVLHVSYGRTEFGARDIAVSCVDDNGNAFDISSYSARILGKKPDGHDVYNVCPVVGSVILIDVTQQMTAVVGSESLALFLASADKYFRILYLNLTITESQNPDDIVSADEMTAIDSLDKAAMQSVKTYVDLTYDVSELASFKAAAEEARDTAAGSATAASNSATAAAGSALAASNSAGSASDSATEASESAGESSASAEQASLSAGRASGSAEAASDAKGVCEDKAREVSTYATAAVTATEPGLAEQLEEVKLTLALLGGTE